MYIATAFQNCEAVRPAEKCLGSFRMFWSAVFLFIGGDVKWKKRLRLKNSKNAI